MILTLLTIVISYVYILVKIITPSKKLTIFDDVMTKLIFSFTTLASVEMLIVFSPFGLVIGVPMLMMVWNVIYAWISYVSDSSGNPKMKEDMDKFKDILLGPVNAIVFVWNTVVNGISSVFGVIVESWNNIKAIYESCIKTLVAAWNLFVEIIVTLWYEGTLSLKRLWNQMVKIYSIVVSLGGTIDEEILPPIPDQFVLQSKEELNNGLFWKYNGEDTIYWSEVKTDYEKTLQFSNKYKYINTREYLGFESKDESLRKVKKINKPKN